ncbi:hypothetical protein [Fulvimarina endophytica]|uniref:hypothetical protein n=1 Tax=Fulvimarina endophytica TaxID=2293836 RepID=UPI001314A77B|nr:hypothetical protein [Fulvimarina endophytica]
MSEFAKVFADAAVRNRVREIMDDRPCFRIENGVPESFQSKLDELDRVVAEKAIRKQP